MDVIVMSFRAGDWVIDKQFGRLGFITNIDSYDQVCGIKWIRSRLGATIRASKTHLLTALANNLIIKKQVSVLYFPFVEGFNDLKDNFDFLEEKLTKMKRIGVLFIDDLFKGRQFPTDFQIEQMFAVINYRYLNHKPIMVSSEKTVDELCDIDEALGTRIYQMSKDYTVVIKGDRKVLNHRLAGVQE